MNLNTVRLDSNDIVSLVTVLVGGKLIDCFNDQNNSLNVLVMKNDSIYHVTSPELSLRVQVAHCDQQFTHPICDIRSTVVSNEHTITFVIGDMNYDLPVIHKTNNYEYKYDETCELGVDIIDETNYTTILPPKYRLANYEAVKADLKHGIELETFGLFRMINTPTCKMAIVKGESLLDGTTQHLIYEHKGF